jgi:NADH:ubiquinone oxidoreductase subunit 4 (subunit M)
MIPLLWMLVSRYGIYYNINSTGDSLGISVSKGIGQSAYLLLWYGLLSGSLLYIGWYNLFLSLGSTTLYDLTSLLSYQKGLSTSCVYGVVLVFLSGCVKLSLCPFHVWLGKVHVESSTIGSVLLASVSLKTGFYLHVCIWSALSLLPTTVLDVFICLFLFGGFVSSLTLFYQVDCKRWIALYSISHMNLFYLLILGCIRSGSSIGNYLLPILQYGMLGHSLISGGLFFIIGGICDRLGSRIIYDLSGNFSVYESCFLFLLLLANSGYPLLVLFIYELLGYVCLVDWDFLLACLCGFLSCLCLLSSILMHSRLCCVNKPISTLPVSYSNSTVVIICSPLCLISIFLGLQCFYPINNLS